MFKSKKYIENSEVLYNKNKYKIIKLFKGKYHDESLTIIPVIIDANDYEIINKLSWSYDNGEIVNRRFNEKITMHWYILTNNGMTVCRNMIIEHINGINSDNRKINLRIVKRSDMVKKTKKKRTTNSISEDVNKMPMYLQYYQNKFCIEINGKIYTCPTNKVLSDKDKYLLAKIKLKHILDEQPKLRDGINGDLPKESIILYDEFFDILEKSGVEHSIERKNVSTNTDEMLYVSDEDIHTLKNQISNKIVGLPKECELTYEDIPKNVVYKEKNSMNKYFSYDKKIEDKRVTITSTSKDNVKIIDKLREIIKKMKDSNIKIEMRELYDF